MLLSIADNCVCDHQPSLLLVPWWELGHLPITAKCLNSFSTCSGVPCVRSCRHNAAARATGAQLLPSFQAVGRGRGAGLYIPPSVQPWISAPCQVFTAASVQAGSHRLGPQTVWCLRVLEEVASLLQRAGWILQKLALMTWCSQCFSYRYLPLCLLLFEMPTQAVERLGSISTISRELTAASLPNSAFSHIMVVAWNQLGGYLHYRTGTC